MSRHSPLAVALGLGLGGLLAGCSLVTVEQDPFPPLLVQAKRPEAPPPRVILTASSIQIGEKIQFEIGKADIKEESFGLLGEIVALLKDNPQIEVLQIEGHTDSTGGADLNRRLSNDRAKSVRAYLVASGIDGKRLIARGFGPDKPIGSNDTEEGREANRRVEFNIVKQGPKRTVIEED